MKNLTYLYHLGELLVLEVFLHRQFRLMKARRTIADSADHLKSE